MKQLDSKTVRQWEKRFVKRTPRNSDHFASSFECTNSVVADNPVLVSVDFQKVTFADRSTDYRHVDVTLSAKDCRRLAKKLNGIADMLDFWNEPEGERQ